MQAFRSFGLLSLIALGLLSLIVLAQTARAETWAEKLGYPSGKIVLMLHADDIGMCYEANQAAKAYLTERAHPVGGLDGALPLVQRNGRLVQAASRV